MAPVKFQKMIIKLLSLEFSEAPPYQELIDLLINHIYREVKIGPNLEPIRQDFEWLGGNFDTTKYFAQNLNFNSYSSQEFFKNLNKKNSSMRLSQSHIYSQKIKVALEKLKSRSYNNSSSKNISSYHVKELSSMHLSI